MIDARKYPNAYYCTVRHPNTGQRCGMQKYHVCSHVFERHTSDSDCRDSIDPRTKECVLCGVVHGDPCTTCGGRGFHVEGCSLLKNVVPWDHWPPREQGVHEEASGTDHPRARNRFPDECDLCRVRCGHTDACVAIRAEREELVAALGAVLRWCEVSPGGIGERLQCAKDEENARAILARVEGEL